MKRGALITLIFLMAFNSHAQEKKLSLRIYVSPSICQSPTQYRTFKDGQVTLTNMGKSNGLFFGGGLELLKKMNTNWLIGGNFDFVSKGYLATRDTTYNNGSLSGTEFTRTDLNFLETTIFIEKQIIAQDPKYKFMFSAGLFYGLHVPNYIGFDLEANGNDFGASIAGGIQRKKVFFKLDYKKGLIIICNNANAFFKTNIISFKVGVSII